MAREGTFFANPTEAVQLTLRVMDDPVCGHADAAYLFAVTPENMDPIIEVGAKLYCMSIVQVVAHYKLRVGKVVFLGLARKCLGDYGTPAMSDSQIEPHVLNVNWVHSGYEDWRQRLVDRGVSKDDIIVNPLSEPMYEKRFYHTHTEAVAFVKLAKERGWKNLVIVSHSAHILRATAETVTAVLNHYPEAKVFVAPGRGLSWCETALQSQSDSSKSRIDSMNDEIAKMDDYYRRSDSDLRSAKEILAYFKKRDRQMEAEFEMRCLD